jgi:preprotein translocase SecE subunit
LIKTLAFGSLGHAALRGDFPVSIVKDSTQYIRDSIDELKKVHSPTRAETIQATVVTFVIMVVVSVVLFLLDLLFGRTLLAIIG